MDGPHRNSWLRSSEPFLPLGRLGLFSAPLFFLKGHNELRTCFDTQHGCRYRRHRDDGRGPRWLGGDTGRTDRRCRQVTEGEHGDPGRMIAERAFSPMAWRQYFEARSLRHVPDGLVLGIGAAIFTARSNALGKTAAFEDSPPAALVDAPRCPRICSFPHSSTSSNRRLQECLPKPQNRDWCSCLKAYDRMR